jgi:multidrug resistance efflux pump
MSEKIYIHDNDQKREMNAEELTQYKKDVENERLLEAENQAKQAKLDSAKAKLAALGLDEEEVAAIVGGI